MKNYFTSIFMLFMGVFGSFSPIFANCVFDQLLKAEEFPIGVKLSWSTAQELNNSMFIIEKSENGVDFSPIGTVRAAGTSSGVKKYHFLDAQASAKKVTYRLKQVDFDGKAQMSEKLSIEKKYETSVMLVQLTSETVTQSLDFTVDALRDGGAVMHLINGQNEVVWQGTKIMSQGLNNISIDMSQHPQGVYKIAIMMEKDEKNLTVRKIK